MADNQTEQLGNRLKAISADVKLYIEKRIELMMLDIGEHMSRFMAESMQKIGGLFLLLGALVCLLVALAIYLGELLNSESLGYVLVSIPLLIFGFMFVYLKPKSLLNRIQDHFESEIIRAISPNGEEENKQRSTKKLSEHQKTQDQ